jgi:two-component system, chemotaxis family, chemotaxis protein CheY
MKLKALVVDDSRVMRSIIIQSVRKTELAEFEFIEAEDGSDALGKFSPKHTNIMFVDWNMPRLTGIDFVRQVRASGKTAHIPIVMVTSEKSMGKIQEALDEAGADEYITKPFTVEEMSRKLSRLIAAMPAAKPEEPAGFLGKLFGGG